MKKSEQLNLRLPKELLVDLDKIADILRVNKSEWIKTKLGELVHSEKSKLIEQYVELHKKGLIDKKELQRLIK